MMAERTPTVYWVLAKAQLTQKSSVLFAKKRGNFTLIETPTMMQQKPNSKKSNRHTKKLAQLRLADNTTSNNRWPICSAGKWAEIHLAAWAEADSEDILGQMFQGGRGAQFGGRTGNPFGGQPRRQSSPKARGADIKVGLEISLEEAEQGGSFSFTFKRLKPNQSGTMEAKICDFENDAKTWCTHGTTKRMKGQGHDHPEGEAGDVILTIRLIQEKADIGMERYLFKRLQPVSLHWLWEVRSKSRCPLVKKVC